MTTAEVREYLAKVLDVPARELGEYMVIASLTDNVVKIASSLPREIHVEALESVIQAMRKQGTDEACG